MHIFFWNVVDESGGRVGTGGDKYRYGSISVAIGNKCGDHGFVLKDLHECHGGEGGLLATKELIHGLLTILYPGALLSRPPSRLL